MFGGLVRREAVDVTGRPEKRGASRVAVPHGFAGERLETGLASRYRWLGIAGFFVCCLLAILTIPEFAFAQDEVEVSKKTVLDALLESGFMGLIIVVCSIVGLALTITFAFQIRRDVLVPPELLGHMEQLFEDEDYEEAYHTCEANPCYLSAVISGGLEKMDDGYEAMVDTMAEISDTEATKMQQKVSYLSLIANIAPMLGLLGTVFGMIVTFNEIANSPVQPKPKDLASGISIALGTTFLGLSVAIPMTIIYVFFRNRVINVVAEINSISDELMSRFKTS